MPKDEKIGVELEPPAADAGVPDSLQGLIGQAHSTETCVMPHRNLLVLLKQALCFWLPDRRAFWTNEDKKIIRLDDYVGVRTKPHVVFS